MKTITKKAVPVAYLLDPVFNQWAKEKSLVMAGKRRYTDSAFYKPQKQLSETKQ